LLFDLPGIDLVRHERRVALDQLDDHVIPRLENLDAPALIVVGGSTGAGKSTLVNSLVGESVTVPGVLRPTTRAPVLVSSRASLHWFEDTRVLPGLARVSHSARPDADRSASTADSPHSVLELVTTDRLPDNIAILDAPDVDSVVAENRDLATQLLAAADLWVFVTTAARYADAVPWEHLRTAAARGVSLVLVLNRVPPGALGPVGEHLRTMLDEQGLAGVHVYGIEEQPLVDGRIEAATVNDLRGWLTELATDADARDRIVRATLRGVIDDLAARCNVIADSMDEQRGTVSTLRSEVDTAFAAARSQLAEDVQDGAVLRGEVLDRWQDVVGTGELIRQLESRLGRLRDRVTAAITGRTPAAEKFTGALGSGVAVLVRRRAAEAEREAYEQWTRLPAGQQLIAGAEDDLAQPSADLDERTAASIREWQAGLVDLLRTEGASKRSTARFLSYGVNGTALVLMVAVFAQTGGLTGAEVAIAGGTSAVGTKLLEALLGDQAVRRLAEQARADLDRRVGVVLDREAQRFYGRLDSISLDIEAADELRTASRQLTDQIGEGVLGPGWPRAENGAQAIAHALGPDPAGPGEGGSDR
jgi:energy-coupling factor transporter ATP-binding protein EcfA2